LTNVVSTLECVLEINLLAVYNYIGKGFNSKIGQRTIIFGWNTHHSARSCYVHTWRTHRKHGGEHIKSI